MPDKLVLVVIDGLTADAFEAAAADARTPTLALLADAGRYRRACSTFPSLTPVCLSSIATGVHPDGHGIPHLVWYHRDERRVVEYGSSFAALRAAGFGRALRDTIVDMSARHLRADAPTVFEALEDAGKTPAAINFTCYRGRTRHLASVPGVPAVYGPKRFFYFNLFESDATGAPLAVRNRAGGSIDDYAAAVGRWLVTRDGFDALVFYLSDVDFASHLAGPSGIGDALARADGQVRALLDAAGGPDEFLDRYALLVCSDHGQSAVRTAVQLERRFAGVPDVLVTASNRAGMVYRLGQAPDAATLAARLDGDASVDCVLYAEDGDAVLRRDGEELRFRPDGGAWQTDGDESVAEHPQTFERAWSALRCPNAGEIIVSAAPGFEFADLAGRSHVGGGSHGSLAAEDSEVPMLSIGAGDPPGSIVDVAPLILERLGLEPAATVRANRAAA